MPRSRNRSAKKEAKQDSTVMATPVMPATQVIPAIIEDAQAEKKPKIFTKIIGNEEITFEVVGNDMKIVNKRALKQNQRQDNKRAFRLRRIARDKRGIYAVKRYTFNPGAGKRNLKFWQRHGEWDTQRDPTKENIHIVDPDIARILETMPDTFEEVYH